MVKELVKTSEKRRPTGESRAEEGWEKYEWIHEGQGEKKI